MSVGDVGGDVDVSVVGNSVVTVVAGGSMDGVIDVSIGSSVGSDKSVGGGIGVGLGGRVTSIRVGLGEGDGPRQAEFDNSTRDAKLAITKTVQSLPFTVGGKCRATSLKSFER